MKAYLIDDHGFIVTGKPTLSKTQGYTARYEKTKAT